MKTSKLNRFSGLPFRNGKTATNRVVVPAMASETANALGFATEKSVAHYRRLGESGAGIVMVEYSFVSWSGRSEPQQLGVDRDDKIPGLQLIARAIHESHALAFLQLTHAGGKTERALTGGVVLGPSNVQVPVKDRQLEPPVSMSASELLQLKADFEQAAGRAFAAGFDGVELHAAHGYGLNQWLSGITNQRSDEYGGSAVNRQRLVLELVREIRAQYPLLLVSIRIPGQDWLEGGLTAENMESVAGALEDAGADLLNVSSGLGGWRRPNERRGEGYLVSEASQIQAVVNLPVIGVGGIESGDYIDLALAEGRFALAAVGRAILRDPRAWGENVLNQNERKRTYG